MHHPQPAAAQSNRPAPQDKTNKALELLYEGVTNLLDSESWKEALKFRSKFHAYSFRNACLIYLQCPTATLVAGYRRWQERGRQVRKGETSLAILAPILKKVEGEGGDEERRVVGFRTARVFDISQTDGEPLPELPRPVLLEDDSESIQEAFQQAKAFAISKGFPVQIRDIHGGALGRFSLLDSSIALQKGLPPLQMLKTLVHELAHGLMHKGKVPTNANKHVLELEAESCAFLVLHELGLDTSRYSFAYLASWMEKPEELLEAGERASKAAAEVVQALSPAGVAEKL